MPQTQLLSLKEHLLAEKIDNYFIKDVDGRLKWADQVWDILQSAYSAIGGIKGSGFRSKEDMVKNIPMWKIMRRGDNVKVVMMYKDKSGRKRVAVGTDGTPEAKEIFKKMVRDEALSGRAWGEISGPSLRFAKKIFSAEEFEAMLIPFEKVKELLPHNWESGTIRPVKGSKYEFEHNLSGEWIRKVAIGKPGRNINVRR